MTEKIAIFGAGNVGGKLAETLLRHGRSVRLGVRPESDVAGIRQRLDGVEVGGFAEAAAWGDVVFVALATAAAVPVARAVRGELAGKIFVDCTNPVGWNDGPVYDPPPAGSVAAALAQAVPEARVVKGFNTFGAEIHGNPSLGGEAADVLLAGDDREAKKQLATLARELGFDPIDAGPLRNAALLENLAILWIHLALQEGHGREWGFQMRGR